MKKYLVILTLVIAGLVVSMNSQAANYRTIVLNDQNTINFNQAYTSGFVSQKQYELINLAFSSKEKDLYVVLNSPGGSVTAGNLFIDTVKALGKRVHTITIFSASMAYNTVQQLDNRYILPSGVLMSHRASLGGLQGQFPGELNKRLDLYMKMTSAMSRKAAQRVGIPLSVYEKQIHDELWLHNGEDAVRRGHADEVVLAKCDASLQGTYKEKFQTFFGSVDVTLSRCPIIIAPIAVEGSNEAVLEFNQKLSRYRLDIKSTL